MNLFILSENEKSEILNLHKKFINENTNPVTEILPGVANDKVLELQNLLKTKFGSYITADSKLGPKTLDSAIRALLGQEQIKSVVQPKKVQVKKKVQPVQKNDSKPSEQPTVLSNLDKYMPNPFSNPIQNKYSLTTGEIKLNNNDLTGEPKQFNPPA